MIRNSDISPLLDEVTEQYFSVAIRWYLWENHLFTQNLFKEQICEYYETTIMQEADEPLRCCMVIKFRMSPKFKREHLNV